MYQVLVERAAEKDLECVSGRIVGVVFQSVELDELSQAQRNPRQPVPTLISGGRYLGSGFGAAGGGLMMVVLFSTFFSTFAGGLMMVVLFSTFFSSLAGGVMIVVFFSITFSTEGAAGRLSHAVRKPSAAVAMIADFIIGRLRVFAD